MPMRRAGQTREAMRPPNVHPTSGCAGPVSQPLVTGMYQSVANVLGGVWLGTFIFVRFFHSPIFYEVVGVFLLSVHLSIIYVLRPDGRVCDTSAVLEHEKTRTSHLAGRT
jgi:hypothetical protein